MTPRPPGRAEIIRVVPRGSRRIRSPNIERIYLEQLGQYQPLLELRPIARAHTLAVAKQLARHASWDDGTSRPTRARITSLTACCPSTWKRARRRLEAWGFLGCVVEGTTPEFAPMALFRRGPNTAAVYVLCLPTKITGPPSPQVKPQTGPPTPSGRRVVQSPARAREANPGETQNPSRAGSAGAQSLRPVAKLMRKAAGQTISDGWVAWIWGPFAAAGWTLRDLSWAIDHQPDGRQHRLSARIRHPVGWLRWRLSLWLKDNQPVPSITAQRRAAGERNRAQAAKTRAASAELAARWTDPAPHAAAIRAQLANRESRYVP